MKDSFYFSHDFEPTNDPKISAMISVYGPAGYGLYWRIVEMLHSESTHSIKFKEYVYMAIAKQMATDAAHVKSFIEDCINRFELFATDGETFYSERVMRNIEARKQLSERRSNAARTAAAAKHSQANAGKRIANAEQTQANGCESLPRKGKESKEKERKEKEIKANEIKENKKQGTPDGLESVQVYFQSIGSTIEMANDFYDYYESVGWVIGKSKKPCKDWRACVRTFLKNKRNIPETKENRFEATVNASYDAVEDILNRYKHGNTKMGTGAIPERIENGRSDTFDQISN